MNLFYHLELSFTIFTIIVFLYRVVNSFDIRTQNHSRYKRVYNGDKLSDGKFSYVVFLKYLDHPKRSSDPCIEKVCTGTLIHRRYVLTLNSCVDEDMETTLRIYFKTRPYQLDDENQTYNIGTSVINRPNIDWHYWDPDNIALVKMNGTFPGVTTFPKILDLDPVPVGEALSCSTVGFGFVGRNLTRPIPESLSAMSYDLEAHLDFTKCVPDKSKFELPNPSDYKATYMCYTGDKPLGKSLCRMGDEGAPLLCKQHGGDKRARRADDSNMIVYGIAGALPRCDHVDKMGTVMFLYTIKYGAWINSVLNRFDEKERKANATTEPSPNSTTASPTESTSSSITTTTVLPAYYDTDEYDAKPNKPRRCKGRGDGNGQLCFVTASVIDAAAAATDSGSQNVLVAAFVSAAVASLAARRHHQH